MRVAGPAYTIAAMALIALVAGCAHNPSAPQLAPQGAMRVAVLVSNPAIGAKDPRTGQLQGTTVDLGRALAERARVPVRFVEYGTIKQLLDDAEPERWDVAAVPVELTDRKLVDFAHPHLITGLASDMKTSAGVQHIAFVLPKRRPGARQLLREFVEEAKASGAVQRALGASGVGGNVRVAPAEFVFAR
jgi:hypothetical protein